MNKIINLNDEEWIQTRKDLTSGVFGKSLIPKDLTDVKITLTKVLPKGEFKPHIDDYDHVFYFLKGKGVGFFGKQQYEIKPELVVHIPAGLEHSYKNTSLEDLILLTINIPQKK